MIKKIAILTFIIGACGHLLAQEKPEEKKKEDVAGIDHSYKPMQLNLTPDGSKYMRFMMWHQFWANYVWNNPGTANVNGEADPTTLNLALRRSRMLFISQVSPRFLIVTHFGINNHMFNRGGADGSGNNITSGSKKPPIFMHDIWNEYAVVKNKLSVGMGLHYFKGISRISSASTITFLAIDAPVVNWPTVEFTDQFVRQFGVYAKGYLGKLRYQVAFNKPFTYGIAKGAIAGQANLSSRYVLNDNAAFEGYLEYNFLEQEPDKTPYRPGTYLGTKKVFNVGAGYYIHGKSMVSTDAGGVERLHDTKLFGFDVFANIPVNKGKNTAFTGYAVLYNYDFGPNYVRLGGLVEVAYDDAGYTGAKSFAGAGNRQPTVGTGSIFYTQMGYALPKMGDKGQFLPFAAFMYKDFEGLNDSSRQFDLGINYLLNGHSAKITLQYSTRPVYNATTREVMQHKGQLLLQTQVFL